MCSKGSKSTGTMSTDDPSGYVPPHELRGPLSTVTDRPSGGVPDAPGPNLATTSSPGLATAALASPLGPTLPSDDPSSFTLVLARMAGELFGGASVIPVPMVPANMLTTTGLSAPGSPGIAPQLVPTMPGHSSVPTDPVTPSLVAATGNGGAPSPDAAGIPSSGSIPNSGVPPLGGGSSAWGLPTGLGSSSPTNGMSSAWGAPAAPAQPTGAPTGGATPAYSSSVQPSGGTGEPGVAAPPLGGSAGSESPFDVSSFDVPLFGDGQPTNVMAMPEAFRMPVIEGQAFDATPYWMPDSTVSSLEPGAAPNEPAIREGGGTAFDPYIVRRDFPILDERVHGGKRLVWLDNAATTQKPRAVIDRLTQFYEHENSNVHRAAHVLAARATDAYESARETTRKFLNASSTSEIIFVRGATEGINLIAQSWGRRNVEEGDEIVLTHLEHHANIVPWQQLCAEQGARLRIAPVDDRGDVILEEYERLMSSRTRLVSFTQVSNALGTITPAREMIEIAHRHGATVLLDGAQAVSHMHVDVQALDCDFYVFSGHKVFAPTGIGAVFGKREVLEAMPPWQGGGNMIEDVTFERTRYQPPPGRFEAGTGNIADAAGMGAALDYIMRIGMNQIDRYEHELMVYATERLATVPGLRMIGTSPNKAGVLSFVLDGQRTEDVGAALDKDGIAVRSGHHCAQPILRRFGLESSVRASLAFYNISEDVDALIDALMRLQTHRRSI